MYNKQEHQKALLEAAQKYLAMGFSIVPVDGRTKKPTIKSWQHLMSSMPTKEEVESWFTQGTATAIGIVTGKFSDLVVIDYEKGATIQDLPDTVTANSGGGGKHFYFKYPEGVNIPGKNRIFPKTDIKSDGGYVIAPPSLHKSLNNYTWEKDFDQIKLADFPDYWLDLMSDKGGQGSKTDFTQIIEGVTEGSRNDSATKIIGKLLHHLPESDWSTVAWPLVEGWNSKNIPPLTEVELKNIFNSIGKKESGKRVQEVTELGQPIHISDLLEKPDQPIEWIVKDLLFVGSLNVISAPPKNFKTWVLLHLASRVAVGKEVFDHFPTEKTNVLFIQEEDFEMIVKKRLKSLQANKLSEIYFWIQRGFKVDKDDHMKFLLDFIKEKNIGLVLLDSLRRVTSHDENNSKEMAEFFDRLMQITKTGVTVLLTHHNRKEVLGSNKSPDQSMRGSSDIFAALHSHLSVQRNFEEKTLAISQNKIKVKEELGAFVVKIVIDPQTEQVDLEYGGELQKELAQKEKAKELVPELLVDGELDQAAIVTALAGEVGRTAVLAALKELVSKQSIVEKRGVKNKKSYRLPGTDV